ncbi:MAG: ProQ/FinO family protein [Candidatus Paracaedibacteraceae bacterium]|nr:ProQ/FinO family protein [Candidatus Paracaedibacteraceae bacterium]
MSTLPPQTISEQLLKLKAAFEDGQRVEEPKAMKTSHVEIKQNSIPTKKTFKIKAKPNLTNAPKRNDMGTASATQETATAVQEKQTAHKNAKSIPLNKNERVIAALQWLYATFPALFKKESKLPLKIGILQDIFDARPEDAPSKKSIRDAISLYTGSVYYQKAILENEKRYNLNGEEIGVVEDKQKEYADQRHTIISAAIQVQAQKRQAYREQQRKKATNMTVNKKD